MSSRSRRALIAKKPFLTGGWQIFWERKSPPLNQRIHIRIILDKFNSEIFVNDGRYVMTATIYTDLSADGISFYADGEAVVDVLMHELMAT